MEQEKLYSIGEFAELTGATIRTLRYYDKIGLLQPSYKDPDNNRRYYSYPEYVNFDFISRLKSVNMSLTQIKNILYSSDLGASYSLLKKKEDEIDTQINELIHTKNRLHDVQMYVGHLQYTDYSDYSIQLKNIPDRYVVYVKGENLKNEKESGILLYKKLLKIEERSECYAGRGWYICIYLDYFENEKEDRISIQVCHEISNNASDTKNQENICKLEGGLYATKRFKGDNIESKNKYFELKKWINDNGYQITAPPLFYWISIPFPRKNFNSMNDQIRELQIRIEKKSS